jgi:hypothetical protein
MRQAARSFAVVVAAGVMAIGLAASPAAAHDLNSDRFRVTTRNISDVYIDVGKKGRSVGDLNIFADKLFHRGERVGRNDVRCEVTQATKRVYQRQCTATMSFRGRGQIAVQGVLTFNRRSPDLVLPITGGSGIYVGAEGTIKVIQDFPVRIQVRLRD